jgi:hypothetical protein
MERREAPAFSKEDAALKDNGRDARRSIPLAFFAGDGKGKTAYPAPQRIRAAKRWLIWLFENLIGDAREISALRK